MNICQGFALKAARKVSFHDFEILTSTAIPVVAPPEPTASGRPTQNFAAAYPLNPAFETATVASEAPPTAHTRLNPLQVKITVSGLPTAGTALESAYRVAPSKM